MTDFRALCAELTDAELANAARKALDSYRYATELPYFLSEDLNEYEPLMLAIRAAIAADRARALLAQPEPPVAGEVAAALIELRSTVMALDQLKMYVAAQRVKRAADLLQHQHPQPVAVSERLPGPEDCDAEGRCWWYGEGGDMVGWTLDAEGPSYYRAKYWLPAHALPVPTND
jgi:hypothetical protein